MTRIKVILALLLILSLSVSKAQVAEKCATVRYNELLENKSSKASSKEDFEKWLNHKISSRRLAQSASKTLEETYYIPVVIHIIHNGEQVGQGSNIPLTQIQEQIKTLNQDFRRTNPDAAKTPDMFKGVAADVNIEFILALQDPDGAPTDGIVRINGKQEIWQFEEGDEMKRLSYWPSEDYLNIWVANLGNNTIGYSQFPTSEVLIGLEEGSTISETDGVVIHYKELGRGGNANRRSRGRTLTHEIGHFLGVKHIWGDDGEDCFGDDYVEDTPNQGGPNNSCPGFPNSTCGNSSDMFMNFMDYTPDTCMNMFTTGQKERMRTILESSPRRTSLRTSKALEEPVILAIDAALTHIVSPEISTCSNTISPIVIIRNLGTSTLTSVTLEYGLSGSTTSTVTKSIEVEAYDTTKIFLPEVSLPSSFGNQTITISVKNPNGSVDQRLENNSLSRSFLYSPTVELPYNETFSDLDLYGVKNPDNLKSWEITNTGGNGENNTSAYIDLLDNHEIIGEKDYLVTPGFSSKGMSNLSLSFKYAYGMTDEFSNDALVVRISLNCGNSFSASNEVFNKSGTLLSTAQASELPFVPSTSGHWREECLNLSNYVGYENLQIAFIAISGRGNNLYIDDIEIKSGDCNNAMPVATEQEKLDEVKFDLYPNPNDGNMFLDLKIPVSDDLEIIVFDAVGKIISKEKVGIANTLHHFIHLPHISSGIHFVKIKGNKINLNKKVIIKK